MCFLSGKKRVKELEEDNELESFLTATLPHLMLHHKLFFLLTLAQEKESYYNLTTTLEYSA